MHGTLEGLTGLSTLTGGAEPYGLLKQLALSGDPQFWPLLRAATIASTKVEDVLRLSAWRKKAARNVSAPQQRTIRLAILGAYTPCPLNDLVAHFLSVAEPISWNAELFLGAYDNYVAEIVEESSAPYDFGPEVVLLLPSHERCRYAGPWTDSRAQVEAAARATAAGILDLCATANARSGAEIVLANFPLPGCFDPGPYRTRTLASDWSFRKFVNIELGLDAPSFVHVCDVEFLAARRGTLDAWDARAWFESKQPYGRGLLLDVAREVAHLIASRRDVPKKAIVLDLDGTLWGGVIGDDGLEGIEIGSTSPRGEAFRAFQQYVAMLRRRGVLLAACSKNDHERAVEPFERHPDMILRLADFAAFKANWQPKSENLRAIASELNLGLDSLVFVDDNPAEIELVRRFVPEVNTLLLGPDPAGYVAQLQDARWFEPKGITPDDLARADRYRDDARRQEFQSSLVDITAYLESLDMRAIVRRFEPVDVPRISQLINKSNQFNLTTVRRSEAQVHAVMADPAYVHFTVRLADRFGDHGLIGVVIARVGPEVEIDTWLMSCRVLKRQVEEEVLNQIVRLARSRGAGRIRGVYRASAKNGMVRDHYPNLGFIPLSMTSPDRVEFELDVEHYHLRPTKIRVVEEPYGTDPV